MTASDGEYVAVAKKYFKTDVGFAEHNFPDHVARKIMLDNAKRVFAWNNLDCRLRHVADAGRSFRGLFWRAREDILRHATNLRQSAG